MNRERAETFLRLLAEAELREWAPHARGAGGAPHARGAGGAPFVTMPVALPRAAWALTAVGAVDLETAEAILADTDLALDARRPAEGAGRGPLAAGPRRFAGVRFTSRPASGGRRRGRRGHRRTGPLCPRRAHDLVPRRDDQRRARSHVVRAHRVRRQADRRLADARPARLASPWPAAGRGLHRDRRPGKPLRAAVRGQGAARVGLRPVPAPRPAPGPALAGGHRAG